MSHTSLLATECTTRYYFVLLNKDIEAPSSCCPFQLPTIIFTIKKAQDADGTAPRSWP